MKFRKAVEADIDSILNIIRQAQNYFKEQGIDQWQNGYP
ncbi:MAG: GNAT family N-acetyltransferase, partial [Thermoanaerobacteraceae bacterium]|nr:GNAT family N-acetyltransferase [Thermoanaerobacteraceae bacterium]